LNCVPTHPTPFDRLKLKTSSQTGNTRIPSVP
jgi:hypothetical protein